MTFIEEADLADMLSDTGIPVVWTPASGPTVSRKALVERHTGVMENGVAVPVKDQIATLLVERAYFAGITIGDAITVDGEEREVRDLGLPMRSMLRIDLALGGS